MTRVKALVDNDPTIEIHDVTDNVEFFYRQADCLLFTSTNEVTPMVISEAMSYGLPILTTSIAGIPEMLVHGTEGFLFEPGDDVTALDCMHQLYYNPDLKLQMGQAGLARFKSTFDIEIMNGKYRYE